MYPQHDLTLIMRNFFEAFYARRRRWSFHRAHLRHGWRVGFATHPSATCGRRRTTRYFSFASGFTTSRAHSMKSFASGLRVRFFKRMIPTGQG
jgi:hypothetical protein